MKIKLISIVIALLILAPCLSSCGDKSENGLILVDPNTGKQYLLKHNVGDSYFIYERTKKVCGKDTTWAFDR
jgi:hypothetical protein